MIRDIAICNLQIDTSHPKVEKKSNAAKPNPMHSCTVNYIYKPKEYNFPKHEFSNSHDRQINAKHPRSD